MSHVLITAGPTREYLDPVRYLSNGSSGKMADSLAKAFLERNWKVTIVSGPVSISYPEKCEVVPVETTSQMLDACLEKMPDANGVVAAAAPCDFRPVTFSEQKIKKEKGVESVSIEFEKTPDVLATLAGWANRLEDRYRPWLVGFALETNNELVNAKKKQLEKGCQAIFLNKPITVGSDSTKIQLLGPSGKVEMQCEGSKLQVAGSLVDWVIQNLDGPSDSK